jgi:hypothetical protein
VIAGLLLAGSLQVAALEVYNWADAQGVEHFSEFPPADPQQALRTLQLDSSPNAAPDRVDTMLKVAEELEASRLSRERTRAEAAARAAEESRPIEQAPPPAPVILYPFPRHPRVLHPDLKPPRHQPDRDRDREPRRHSRPSPPSEAPLHDSATAWGDKR